MKTRFILGSALAAVLLMWHMPYCNSIVVHMLFEPFFRSN